METISTTITTTLFNSTTISSSVTSSTDLSHRISLASRPWLIAILISTIVVALSIGVIHYYRRQLPHKRFLQNWRLSASDDRIVQLEDPEIVSSPWQTRIAFA